MCLFCQPDLIAADPERLERTEDSELEFIPDGED